MFRWISAASARDGSSATAYEDDKRVPSPRPSEEAGGPRLRKPGRSWTPWLQLTPDGSLAPVRGSLPAEGRARLTEPRRANHTDQPATTSLAPPRRGLYSFSLVIRPTSRRAAPPVMSRTPARPSSHGLVLAAPLACRFASAGLSECVKRADRSSEPSVLRIVWSVCQRS